MRDATEAKLKRGITQLLRNVIYYKITANNCIWRWKVANLTSQFFSHLKQQRVELGGVHTMGAVIGAAIGRRARDLLARLTPSAPMNSVFALFARNVAGSMRKAW
jgi:hypothetical protein